MIARVVFSKDGVGGYCLLILDPAEERPDGETVVYDADGKELSRHMMYADALAEAKKQWHLVQAQSHADAAHAAVEEQ